MSLLVVGTIPFHPGRVVSGRVEVNGDGLLSAGGEALPGCQGTTAMLLAAETTARRMGSEVHALLGGDVGRGEGTRAAYSRLEKEILHTSPSVVAFHYLLPIMALMRDAVSMLRPRVEAGALRLVADAGGMYAARASGVGAGFELMTPDAGEVGFLADECASHPAYVSRHLLGTEGFDPLVLAVRAQAAGMAARVILVKGQTDYVVEETALRGTTSEPLVPELEAIGGTGDTLTGIVTALMASGMDTVRAALIATRVNREAGALLGAQPDHGPADLVSRFDDAFDAIGVGTATQDRVN